MTVAARTQFLRFALVGCAGFVVDAGVLNAVLLLGADRYSGRLVSYLVAATATWALNRNYTFREQRDARRLREWGRFLASNALGGLVNWVSYAMLVSVSGTVRAHPVIGVAVGSLAGLAVNFTLSRRFVFNDSKPIRLDRTIVAMTLISLAVTLGSKVNPWPRDGWFESQFYLGGHFPGYDNYAPVSAPAVVFRGAGVLAESMGLGLAGNFYISSILQNLLVLLSAFFVYFMLKAMRLPLAGLLAVCFLVLVLSTGLTQVTYSESTVLFLMSAVMFIVVLLPRDARDNTAKFWALTALSGVLVSLLVLTRMTPVFLIPAIALLFFRRMPMRRIVQFTSVLTVMTAALMTWLYVSNHERFGRYELTNSSGRHLWQGVTTFVDEALASSPGYQRLKALNPNIQGLNWWQVPPVVPPTEQYLRADPRDPVLNALAKEAIRNAPGRYVATGAKKFVTTIGVAPYRLGHDSAASLNPLQRTEPLPALAGRFFNRVVEAVFRRLDVLIDWAYPIAICAIVLTWLARGVQILRQRTSKPLTLLFVAAALPLVMLPFPGSGFGIGTLLAAICCAALLVIALVRLPHVPADNERAISYFSFFAMLFFGSLWFSWQIELENSRNAIPYLPAWTAMLAMTVAYWKRPVIAVPRQALTNPSVAFHTSSNGEASSSCLRAILSRPFTTGSLLVKPKPESFR
jgi:putative flippase GtrA/4-amino-4-deoxy-L-arabinose transferase-like glycosyltransferase